MKYLLPSALGVLGALVFATSVSAAVVCNEDGDCWRVKEKYNYPPNVNVRIYADDWKWDDAEADRYRWREVGKGRGFYRGGVWINF